MADDAVGPPLLSWCSALAVALAVVGAVAVTLTAAAGVAAGLGALRRLLLVFAARCLLAAVGLGDLAHGLAVPGPRRGLVGGCRHAGAVVLELTRAATGAGGRARRGCGRRGRRRLVDARRRRRVDDRGRRGGV